MNTTRWIFFLTETDHPPTAESEKLRLDDILKDEDGKKIYEKSAITKGRS